MTAPSTPAPGLPGAPLLANEEPSGVPADEGGKPSARPGTGLAFAALGVAVAAFLVAAF
jgi:hypothetical protein